MRMGRRTTCPASRVALRTEGVDRNQYMRPSGSTALEVALRTEGVDRNIVCTSHQPAAAGRPPHGGRG